MQLILHGEGSIRTINIRKEFFEDSKVKTGRGFRTITPSEKAEELGNDIYGRKYLGHVLENDGKVISNTVENRNLRKASDSRPHKSKPTAEKSALGLKFVRADRNAPIPQGVGDTKVEV